MKKQGNLTAQSKLIVVVDDDVAVRKSLKFSLEVEGFIVRTYARGEELLNEAIFPACNCLVIDQMLPGINGIDLIAELRDRKLMVPVILITTHPNLALIKCTASAGVQIIEKPLLGTVLLDGIHQAITRPASSEC